MFDNVKKPTEDSYDSAVGIGFIEHSFDQLSGEDREHLKTLLQTLVTLQNSMGEAGVTDKSRSSQNRSRGGH